MAFARIDRLSLRFFLSVAILILCSQAAGFFVMYQYAENRMVEASRQQAALATRLVHLALEDGMTQKDDHLVRRMVKAFGGAGDLQRVMIIDREGEVRFSSDPSVEARHFEQNSATCLVCHQNPAESRERSAMLEIEGGRTLRVVDPVPNRVACYGCHDESHRINGLVVVDVPLEGALDDLRQAMGPLAAASSAIGLSLLAGTGLVFRRLLVRRLRRFEKTARAIAKGDFSSRVPVVQSDDALTRVETQFNSMADAVAALLGRVREQRADLERVMNSVDDGMVVLDRERTVVAANEAFARRFPIGDATLIGVRCCGDRERGGLGCHDDGFCPTLHCFGAGHVQTAIKRRVQPDGSVRHEEVRASPVFGEDGQVSHVVEVWRDITDRRSEEAKLADTERMVSLGMLASGFSHEVNTPLGSIGMCLDGIGRVASTNSELDDGVRAQIAEYVGVASKQVRRAGAITEQFLRLARGQSLSASSVDPVACADSVAALCRQKTRAAGVELKVVEPAARPSVVADESAVQQVFLNLILNAIDACESGHHIAVTFAVEPGRLLARVADDGRGIAPGDLPRVFEPFFSRRAAGTGLGLFVSLNLAHSWNGDITLESAPGEGTTFTVHFPIPTNGDA
ncbi:PAS domain-containing protein [bacterium]|nr:PAS domain-containing protein [bacterium]